MIDNLPIFISGIYVVLMIVLAVITIADIRANSARAARRRNRI